MNKYTFDRDLERLLQEHESENTALRQTARGNPYDETAQEEGPIEPDVPDQERGAVELGHHGDDDDPVAEARDTQRDRALAQQGLQRWVNQSGQVELRPIAPRDEELERDLRTTHLPETRITAGQPPAFRDAGSGPGNRLDAITGRPLKGGAQLDALLAKNGGQLPPAPSAGDRLTVDKSLGRIAPPLSPPPKDELAGLLPNEAAQRAPIDVNGPRMVGSTAPQEPPGQQAPQVPPVPQEPPAPPVAPQPDPAEARRQQIIAAWNARNPGGVPAREPPSTAHYDEARQGYRQTNGDLQRMWAMNTMFGDKGDNFRAVDMGRGLQQDYDQRLGNAAMMDEAHNKTRPDDRPVDLATQIAADRHMVPGEADLRRDSPYLKLAPSLGDVRGKEEGRQQVAETAQSRIDAAAKLAELRAKHAREIAELQSSTSLSNAKTRADSARETIGLRAAAKQRTQGTDPFKLHKAFEPNNKAIDTLKPAWDAMAGLKKRGKLDLLNYGPGAAQIPAQLQATPEDQADIGTIMGYIGSHVHGEAGKSLTKNEQEMAERSLGVRLGSGVAPLVSPSVALRFMSERRRQLAAERDRLRKQFPAQEQ